MTDTPSFDVLTWPEHDGLPNRATAAHVFDDEDSQPLMASGQNLVKAVSGLRTAIAEHLGVDAGSFKLRGVTGQDERVCKAERKQLQGMGL